jgi:hypothetical protein
MHDLDCFLLVLDGADVPAAQAEDRNLLARLAERPGRQALADSWLSSFLDLENAATYKILVSARRRR